jgi:hypothetical protein
MVYKHMNNAKPVFFFFFFGWFGPKSQYYHDQLVKVISFLKFDPTWILMEHSFSLSLLRTHMFDSLVFNP